MHYFPRRPSGSGASTAAASTAPKRAASARSVATLHAALQALNGNFVVADLETTGLSTTSCEILEFAAVQVSANGSIVREFTQVVRTQGAVQSFITRLTGITQSEVDQSGVAPRHAFSSFLAFIEDMPVFFHNASFDKRFLNAAAEQMGLPFANHTHCTLALARRAWPELASHKLDILARHVGASQPTHRALADVHTTVSVALAARARLS